MIVLHILLLVLKIIGILLLCVLGLILLLCFVPVGVTAEYSADGPLVLAHAGPVRLKLIPKKEKSEDGETPKKKKINRKMEAKKKITRIIMMKIIKQIATKMMMMKIKIIKVKVWINLNFQREDLVIN